MKSRPEPIFFWSFDTASAFDNDSKPYIDPELQEGTTPLAKMMGNKYTRTFRNFHYPAISESHFGGWRVMLGNRYKLLVNKSAVELFDLTKDPAETENLAETHPEIVTEMQKQLHAWQKSVLTSLTGADYN